MKATKNITRIAKMSITSIALIAASFLTPVQASTDDNSALNRKELKEAVNRLETLNYKTENAIKFSAPAMIENTDGLFESEAAQARLDDMAVSLERSLQYISPSVNESMADQELNLAVENLEQLISKTEQIIKFSAPSFTE